MIFIQFSVQSDCSLGQGGVVPGIRGHVVHSSVIPGRCYSAHSPRGIYTPCSLRIGFQSFFFFLCGVLLHSAGNYLGTYPGMITTTRLGTRLPQRAVCIIGATLATLSERWICIRFQRCIFCSIFYNSLQVSGYVPEYDHDNQLWYPGTLDDTRVHTRVPYKMPPGVHIYYPSMIKTNGFCCPCTPEYIYTYIPY